MSGRPSSETAWYAANLSLIFPGLGQLHLGQWGRGLGWLLGGLGFLIGIFWCYLAPGGNVQIGAGLLGTSVMLWAFNVLDAHACALGGWKQKPESFGLLKDETQRRPLHQEPWFGALLSQGLPGLGQLYLRQYPLAAVLFALVLISLTLFAGRFGLILGIPALAAFSVYQLAASSGVAKAALRTSQAKDWQRRAVMVAIAVFLARSLLLGSVPLARLFVEPFSVPSESMFPTLMVGDRILVRKQQNYRPAPGDIVVFQDPSQTEERLFVKRVVGVSGDRIEVKPGQTLRNDVPLDEPYTSELPQYVWDSGVIPPGHLVVLGDNRNASYDSSHWGSLSMLKVVGRVYRVSWPPENSRPIDPMAGNLGN